MGGNMKALYFRGDETKAGIIGYYTSLHSAFNNVEYYVVQSNNYWGGLVYTRQEFSKIEYPITNPAYRQLWEGVLSRYNYTLMAWVNPYYLDKTPRYVIKDECLQGANAYIDAKIVFYHDRIEAQHKYNPSGIGLITYKDYLNGTLLKVDTWYHVCITFGSDDPWSLTKTCKFYVNGNLVGSYDYVVKTTTLLVSIGGPADDISFGYHFIGLFNGFKSFRNILTQSQIQYHMNNPTDYTDTLIWMNIGWWGLPLMVIPSQDIHLRSIRHTKII